MQTVPERWRAGHDDRWQPCIQLFGRARSTWERTPSPHAPGQGPPAFAYDWTLSHAASSVQTVPARPKDHSLRGKEQRAVK